MHRIPIGPMGADRKIPIDTQPINMDRIVPTTEGLKVKTYKDTNKFSVISFQITVFLELIPKPTDNCHLLTSGEFSGIGSWLSLWNRHAMRFIKTTPIISYSACAVMK